MTAAAPRPLRSTAGRALAQSESLPLLRIDLAAVRANYMEMRRRFRGSVLSAVLKSDAYGIGLEALASTLARACCRLFWGNDLDEAMRVRTIAPEATVCTLMGLSGQRAADFEAAGVMPALTSILEVEHCARHAATSGRRLPVAIQLDTGLGRLGLGEEEVEFLAAQPQMLHGLDVRLYASHLASYNLPDDPTNDEQRRRLLDWTSRLPRAPISLAASSAVFMPHDWHFDVARVGSALLGVQTSVRRQEGLTPCYELSAPLIRIADYPAGRRLGYRGVSLLGRPSRIATAAIGYANGLPQSFADVGSARIAGFRVPIVGGLSMNMTMLDLTDLPDEVPLAGARAIFFDAVQPIEPVADRLGCAPNALLTQIGAGTRKAYEER